MCNAVQPCLKSIKAAKRSMSASLLMNHKNLETKVSEKKTKDFNAKKRKKRIRAVITSGFQYKNKPQNSLQ